MNRKPFIVVGVVIGLLAGAWFARDAAPLRPVVARLGVAPADAAPDTAKTLAAAGVHKCRVGARVVYSDQPCPAGSRELAANGGTVTVMSFPKPAPVPASAASGLAGALVKGLSRDEIDVLRDKQVEDAAKR